MIGRLFCLRCRYSAGEASGPYQGCNCVHCTVANKGCCCQTEVRSMLTVRPPANEQLWLRSSYTQASGTQEMKTNRGATVLQYVSIHTLQHPMTMALLVSTHPGWVGLRPHNAAQTLTTSNPNTKATHALRWVTHRTTDSTTTQHTDDSPPHPPKQQTADGAVNRPAGNTLLL